MSKHRLIPEWPFPPYVFIPGENPHPKKTGGHMEGESDPVTLPIDPLHPEKSDFLRYSIDLYNAGYFWESHVYFEALWNAHGRSGSIADFLKGMIKLGAAGVKIKIQQPVSATDHYLRARELFSSVAEKEGTEFLGFDLKKLNHSIDLVLENKEKDIIVFPSWN